MSQFFLANTEQKYKSVEQKERPITDLVPDANCSQALWVVVSPVFSCFLLEELNSVQRGVCLMRLQENKEGGKKQEKEWAC